MIKVFYDDSAPGLAGEVKIAGEVYRRGDEYTVKNEAGELLLKKGFKPVEPVSEYKPSNEAAMANAVAECEA